MNVSLAPRAILVTRPEIDWAGVDEVLRCLPADSENNVWKHGLEDHEGDQIPEFFGRLCYLSVGSRQGRVGAKDYLANILSQGHGSVLEHANFGFVIVGASRGCMAQLTRHRAGVAFSIESTHFIKYGEGPGMVTPTVCLAGLEGEELNIAIACLERSLADYGALWDLVQANRAPSKGRKKTVAGAVRALLPTALEARIGMTANIRALRHIIETRGGEENVVEIRYVAASLLTNMQFEAPECFADFTLVEGLDGHPRVISGRKKV